MKAVAVFLFIVLAAAPWTMVPTQGIRPDVFECDRVAMVVRECYTYLRGIDTKPSSSCCNGAKMIVNLAFKPEKQPLGCKCYKEAYSYFDSLKENAMLELSKECNLNVAPLNGDLCSRY
ncbi:unnamed protein product [Dovyalis caffra]|uniref:Bifunctional inhibitor/plant lipid transfer protein/seed storage helical domain-containing protein n=1 Tax=Dovyalis caffra TaxID=77055 RepID=A0AAV1RUH5_9ROSI|nr:unnamed protein product [Dovyalis caffra]